MTELQKKQIETCRENGLTFAEIADVTGLSVGAVKSHFSRKTHEETVVRCRFCGAVVSQPKSQREKHFCNGSVGSVQAVQRSGKTAFRCDDRRRNSAGNMT